MGGEKKGDREVMSNVTRDLVNSGVRGDKAEELARDSMRRVDRRLREQGKR